MDGLHIYNAEQLGDACTVEIASAFAVFRACASGSAQPFAIDANHADNAVNPFYAYDMTAYL